MMMGGCLGLTGIFCSRRCCRGRGHVGAQSASLWLSPSPPGVCMLVCSLGVHTDIDNDE